MTAKPIDAEKAAIRITFARALWIAGGVFVAGGWAAMKLDRIESRLEAIQRNSWTVQDEERANNWLRWDNADKGLKVRDARDVVAARNP